MRNLFRALILTLAISAVSIAASAGDPFLYAGDNQSNILYRIDKTTGATVTTIPVTLGGNPVDAIKGLAAEPGSGMLYAVAIQAEPAEPPPGNWFKLVTIDPATGVATLIGSLNDAFAGLAFVEIIPTDGTTQPVELLMGVTGDGSSNPEQLFVIDPSTASTSLFMSLGNGTDGEAIAWNPNDSMLYHLSGWDSGPPPEGITGIVFEKIDLQTQFITDIPLSGDTFTNGNGLAFDTSTSQFFFSAGIGSPQNDGGFASTELFTLSTTGAAASVGPTDQYLGGIAFSSLVPVELQSFSVE